MQSRSYFESGPRPGRVIEVSAIGDPEVKAGKVKVVPEDKGCSVDATVLIPEEKTTTHFVRSHLGRIPLPFFGARLELATSCAMIKTENAADLAGALPDQAGN